MSVSHLGSRDGEDQQVLTSDDTMSEQIEGGIERNPDEWVCLDDVQLPSGISMSLENAVARDRKDIRKQIISEIGYYQEEEGLIFYRNADGKLFVGPQCKRIEKLLTDGGYRNARKTFTTQTANKGEAAVFIRHIFGSNVVSEIKNADVNKRITQLIKIHREEVNKENQEATANQVKKEIKDKFAELNMELKF